jgi:hypothetical protein
MMTREKMRSGNVRRARKTRSRRSDTSAYALANQEVVDLESTK